MDGVRTLKRGDEDALFAFLERRLESSVILYSNASRAGLEDAGEARQGTYVARFAAGAITALAAHYSNGNVCVQGDAGLEGCVLEAARRSGRRVKGILGPLALVSRARSALGLDGAKTAHDGAEALFVLDLERLEVPEQLASGRVSCRPPTPEEIERPLAAWGAAYCVETLGATPSPELEAAERELMEAWRREGRSFVLERDGELVAYTGFNAIARDIVQVGGVWTPPAQRRRGYARCAVAGSLLEARKAGARRSTLFTSLENVAAIRAYGALGYRRLSDFGLLLFAD